MRATGSEFPGTQLPEKQPAPGSDVNELCDEGKTYLTVAIGCTGGKHRSVMLAERLGERMRRQDLAVAVNHRDLGRE